MKKTMVILLILIWVFIPIHSHASVLKNNSTHMEITSDNTISKEDNYHFSIKQNKKYLLNNTLTNNQKLNTKNLNIVIIFLFGIVIIMMIYTLFKK